MFVLLWESSPSSSSKILFQDRIENLQEGRGEVLPIHRTTFFYFLIEYYHDDDDVIPCYISGNNSKSYSGY